MHHDVIGMAARPLNHRKPQICEFLTVKGIT